MKQVTWGVLLVVVLLAGCTAAPAEPVTPTTSLLTPTPCSPPPIVVPTPPVGVPDYAELDPTTGLHMTGSPVELNLEQYTLEIMGKVDHPLSLTYDDLRCLPRLEQRLVLTCPGFFQDEATWAGASLRSVLDLAGVQQEATGLRLVGGDKYTALVLLSDLGPSDDMIAYEWEGQPLPILHGFPVRAVLPALNGNKWVKWLVQIEVY